MNCQERRLDIVAWLDGSLPPGQVSSLQAHLAVCDDCRHFRAEHLEADVFLRDLARIELEPGWEIWRGIESRIAEQGERASGTSILDALFGWVRLPQLSYSLGAALLLCLTAVIAVQTRQIGPSQSEVLAQLDSFTVETDSNPFVSPEESRNPFFGLEQNGFENPFELGGFKR